MKANLKALPFWTPLWILIIVALFLLAQNNPQWFEPQPAQPAAPAKPGQPNTAQQPAQPVSTKVTPNSIAKPQVDQSPIQPVGGVKLIEIEAAPPAVDKNFELYVIRCQQAADLGKVMITFSLVGEGQFYIDPTPEKDGVLIIGKQFQMEVGKGSPWIHTIQMVNDNQSLTKKYHFSLNEIGCP